MSSKFGRFAKRRAAGGALKPSKYQEGQVMNQLLLASPGDWTSKDNSITAVQRQVTYTERVTYVANKSMDVSKVVLDQLQRLKKLPVPVDADIVLFVSIAMNVATNESVQEVSQAAVKYLAGKVSQMELKVALRNFLEKNPALQLMSRGALQVVQAFWPMIILVIYTKMQTLGTVVDFDDLAPWSPTGCPFSEGCHLLGCISTKYTAEACNCGGRRHCSKGEGLLAKSCLVDSSRCCNVHLSPLPVGNPVMASPNSVGASATCKNTASVVASLTLKAQGRNVTMMDETR